MAVLKQALREAADTRGCATKHRLGARDWLRDLPGFTAKEVCEYLGVSYSALMKRQESKWAALPDEQAPKEGLDDDVEF